LREVNLESVPHASPFKIGREREKIQHVFTEQPSRFFGGRFFLFGFLERSLFSVRQEVPGHLRNSPAEREKG
jgi:hypothetical protein